jgi:PAS domain S-box-containing protein
VPLPVEMSIAHYNRDGRHLFTGIVRDIAERKRLEREQVRLLNMVEHERQRLDGLIKSIPGVVWEIYLDPKRADSNFVSPYVEKIYGITPEEWFADPLRWRELIHPDDLEAVLAIPLHAAPTEGINYTHRILTRDGQVRWLDVRLVIIRNEAGRPEMLRGITLDITDRRSAEEALRLSEERFRITLENSPITVFTQDRDLRYTWVQNAGPRYRAGEVLGRTEEDLFDPHCAEELTRIKLTVLESGVGTRREVKISAKGIISHIDLAVEPYRDADGGIIGVTCVAIDITERKQTADELLLFRTLIDKSNDAIFVIDPFTAGILDVNDTACADLGYSREELLALKVPDIFARVTEDVPWQEPFGMARELGFAVIESVCRHKNGDTFPVELSLTFVTVDQRDYMVAVARDVTERMRAQEAIRRSQEFFQSFMDNIPALAFMKDTEGRYVYCNRHLAEVLGLEIDEVIGRTDLELWPERKGRQLRESDSIVRSLARPLSFTERLDIGNDESYSYVVKFPMLDTGGEPMVAGISIDVTERVRAERRLEENQRLNQAILHSLSTHIAVLDRNGTIVTVNHAWERYPVENGSDSPISASVGANYLDICRRGITSEVEGSRQALRGVQQILSGEVDEFTMEYPSHTPRRKQWFLFSATSLQGLGGAVVSHIDITERKLAEIALRESQMRFLAFANTSPVIFYIKDQKGRYILGNDLFGALVGRPAAELIGKTDFDLWPAEIAAVFAETDRLVLETGAPIEREETIRTGTAIRWWVTIKFPVPDESGNLLIGGAAVEITERVLAEQSLRKSEERFQLATRATNDAIWDWDLLTGTVWWNQNVETLFRYHPDEVSKDISFWYDRIHPEDRERVHERLQNAIDSRQRLWTDDYRFLRGDGTYAYVFDRGHLLYDQDGRVTRMIGAMVDITERKNAEEAVRESEEKYRRIVEAAQEGIVVTDAKGIITFTNARMAQIMGYPVDELLGRPYADLMEEEWRDTARKRANRRREGIAEQYDFRFIRKDGTAVWAIVSANPVFDKHGTIIGSLGMVTDITDRKRAEEALQEAHDKLELRVQERTAEIVAMMAQLEQAHAMQKRFVADASHDLRTPLTVIRAELDLLLNHGNLLPDTRRSLNRVAAEARRLNSLADDLLLLAILDAKDRLSPRQPIRLDELLLESISNLATLALGKEIAWNIEIEEPIELICDPAAVDRAVTNVLENAIKYSPDASVIGVKLSKRDDEAEIEVVDTGVGIPPQDLSKVFDRFYRSDLTRSTPGTGLGLSIVKAVLDAHDGRAVIESTPNLGTTVRLSIPGVEN